MAITLVGCTDSFDGDAIDGNEQTRSALSVETPGGLIQQADGTWLSDNCRVPIVGPGRVVNEIDASTVQVISLNTNGLSNIVDDDITNQSTIPAAISAGVGYTPIVSVKDLYHIYSAGQKVGFVYKDTESNSATLLTLSLLQGLTLTTYLKGVKQESVYAADETSTLKLDLLSFNAGSTVSDRVLQFDATKPFDEVRMSFTGVSATVASNIALAIKYAFVGENPEIRATSEEAFSYYWTGETTPTINKGTFNSLTNVADAEYLVDADTTNSAPFTSELYATSKATVNFNRSIPIGTEIGFCYKTVKVASLDLLGQNAPTLRTLNNNNKEMEESTPASSVLGVSLIGVSGKCFTNIVTTKECTQIQFQHPRTLLDLGGANVYYAYIREAVKLDPANYFTFGNDTTYKYSYKLPTVSEGSVNYYLLSRPYGSVATIENGKLMGLTKDGNYRVQALYTATDGRQVSHIATIYHKSATESTDCNKYITAASHGAYATEAIGWSGCLLCLFNSSNNLNNVVDGNANNYATVNQLASVLEWSPVAAFKMNKAIDPSSTVRAGFVVQASTKLLDLSALSFYKIRLYNGSTLVSEETTDGTSSVKLSLIGSDNSKVRLSVDTDKEFNRIELWRKGVADVLSSIKIYNLFYESSACDESAETGGCMELMTNLKDNLQLDYEHTTISAGLLTAGSSFSDIDYILDGSVTTGAKLSSLLSADGTTISLKFNKQSANQSVGVIIGNPSLLASVKLSDIGVLKVYNGDTKVASTADFNLLDVNLISHNGYTYIEVTPTQDFDRIDFTMVGVDVLKSSKLCGVYIRPDSDGDGIPDCADTDDDSNGLTIADETFHTCYGNPLNISVEQTGDISDVSVYCYNQGTGSDITCSGAIANGVLTIAAKAMPVGQYILYIYSADGDQLLAYDVKATIHPTETTWKTNASTTDWNTWSNWSAGSPWKCTNVILPSNATQYPELTSAASNYCKNIHFESGAEIVGQNYLSMAGQAFVDLSIRGGKEYLLSAPLQEMFTGDMFIAPNAKWSKANYFTLLTADNYKEVRNSPIVYQYFWSGLATDYDHSFNGTDVGKDDGWSTDFNAVNTKYAIGQGFKLRAGSTSDRNSYTFRFPKTHTTYHYYTSSGTATSHSHTIERGEGVGKLMVTSLPCTVTLSRKVAGKIFLLGNPTMAHIDVAALKSGNSNISSVTTAKTLIAPMEAVFVEATSDATTLTVNITADMLKQK